MRTTLIKTWAWVFLGAIATTGCSSTKPFAKMPPKVPPTATGMNPTLNNNTATNNAMAKGGWNQPAANTNPLQIPNKATGNAAPIVPANGAGGMNVTQMNPNQPPPMPGGMTNIPPTINNQPSVQPTNYQMPPQAPAPLNQSNASPYSSGVPTSGQRLPEAVTRNSMPIPASMPEPTTTTNLLPKPVPPAMDVPQPSPMLPSMSMPKPAGLPAPQNLAPPAQLPPVSSVPPAPTPLPVRARPQE